MTNKRDPLARLVHFLRKTIKAVNDQFKAVSTYINSYYQNQQPRRKGQRSWTQDKGIFWISSVMVIVNGIIAWEAVTQSREVSKEFNIANTPYLQIKDVQDSIKAGYCYAVFHIENLGRGPVKILFANCTMKAITNRWESKTATDFAKIIEDSTESLINSYVINGSPAMIECLFPKFIDTTLRKEVLNNRCMVYYYGKVIYEDLITREDRIYMFSVGMIYSDNSFRIGTNENYPYFVGGNYSFDTVFYHKFRGF